MLAKAIAVVASLLMLGGAVYWLSHPDGLLVIAAGVLLAVAAVVRKGGE